MGWIIGIIILILLMVSAGFRIFALGLVAVAVIGGFLWYQHEQREERESLNRISLSELDFQDLGFKGESYSRSSYVLTGRIKNKSNQFTLTSVGFKIKLHDCPKNDSKIEDCIIIGEDTGSAYVNVPPSQARDFKESFYFTSSLSPKGNIRWEHVILYVKGKP